MQLELRVNIIELWEIRLLGGIASSCLALDLLSKTIELVQSNQLFCAGAATFFCCVWVIIAKRFFTLKPSIIKTDK